MLRLAIGFAERDFPVDLVLACASGPFAAEVPSNVRVVDLRARRVLTATPGLVRYMRRERPHAMISAMDYANLVAIWSRWVARVPLRLIISERNTMSQSTRNAVTLRDRAIPTLARWFYPWADGIVAVSQGVADDLVATVRLDSAQVEVIYNPTVAPEIYERASEPIEHAWFGPGEPDVILAVGRLAPQKDYPTLLRAFTRLRERTPCRLMILGEGKARPELEALVAELGIEADVALPGFVANPYPYMARAAVFAMSSAWEGLPNALIEALALGATVVSTDCPSGPREILEEGRWGQLVPVGDVDRLADAMADALKSPNSSDREEAVRRFTRTESVSRFLRAIDR